MPLHNDADSKSSLDRSHMPDGLDALYNWLNGVMHKKIAAGVADVAGFKHYKTAYTTSGNGTGDTATFGTTPTCEIGHRKLIMLETKTASGDHIAFDFASFSYQGKTISAVALTSVGDFALVEWRGGDANGQKWEVLAYSTGVVTHA